MNFVSPPPNEIRRISLKRRRFRLMLGATAMLGLSALAPRAATAQESDALSLAPPPSGGLFPPPSGNGFDKPMVIPPYLAAQAGLEYLDGLGPNTRLPDGTVIVLPPIPGIVITGDPTVPKIVVTYNGDGTKVVVSVDGEGGVSYTFDRTDGKWTYHVQGNNTGAKGVAALDIGHDVTIAVVGMTDFHDGFIGGVLTVPLGSDPGKEPK